jgi:hypothetical protein
MHVPRSGDVTVKCPFCRHQNGITNGTILEHFSSACGNRDKMTVFDPFAGVVSIMGGKKLLVQTASNDDDSVHLVYSATTPLAQAHHEPAHFDALYWMDNNRALPGFGCFIGVKTVDGGIPKVTVFQRKKICVPPMKKHRKEAYRIAHV